MGIGMFEIIGVFLIAFVVGAVLKDWISERAAIMEQFISHSTKEFITVLSTRSRWYHECQQALRRVATLEQTIQQMDEARNALHNAISHDLVPKLKAQETSIDALNTFLEERTQERDTLRQQVKDAYAKLDFMISKHRHCEDKNFKLSYDVDFLRASSAHWKCQYEKLKKKGFTKPLQRRNWK